MQVPDPFWDRFKDKTIVPDPAPENAKKQNLIHTRAALAMCENIDANVGRLIQHLEQTNLADNTIVVYFCDNGPNGSRFNGGMRGRKGSTHEGGLRSPCLIRYPRAIQGGTKVRKVAAAIDLLPTLTDFAGLSLESPKPLDGKSIAPLLRRENGDWSERLIFSAWNGKASVRNQRFRMHAGGGLFDLENDHGEKRDVKSQHPKVAEQLESALNQWIKETKPGLARDKETRPITLGHPDAETTQLPARDAEPHGGIVRSNRFPNCTFMTNWTDTKGQITWNVEVLDEGDFEVEMYYACAADSVGSGIELTLDSGPRGEVEQIESTIEVANEASLRGMENDRFERVEGYVKDWRPMKLGVVRLRPGRATLTLKATKVTGAEVADMRLLMFRRVTTTN